MSDTFQEPTFLPLNGALGWRTGSSAQISVGGDALRLAADPDGPLGLAWPDGSLGGLTLPRGMAIDGAGELYLLAPERPWAVRRLGRRAASFVDLPGIGGEGGLARQLRAPLGLAAAGRRLYVADTGNRRVQLFDLPTLALLQIWEPWELPRWRPVDVAAQGELAYLLDGRRRRVYRHRAGEDRLVRLIDGGDRPGRWERIAIDRAGRIYVLERPAAARPRLLIFDPQGKPELEGDAGVALRPRAVADAGAVRDRFDPPAVRLGFDQRGAGRSYFAPPAWPGHRDDEGPTGFFDLSGARVEIDPAELIEPHLYLGEGEWVSAPLNSGRFGCQWHRVELDLDALPPGTRLLVHTFSADSDTVALPGRDAPSWQAGYAAVGQLQPPASEPAALPGLALQAPEPPPGDFLVQSRQGQYLWLRITLLSDGFATPALRGLRLHFPRESYLSYLPAIYGADEANRWFLERYLSLFQTDWDELERAIAASIAYADPDAVPAGPALDALARRFGLPFEGEWSPEERRTLLQSMGGFYTRRGTVAGLRAYLRAYLRVLSGLAPDRQGDFPLLAESWRERPRLELAAPGDGAGGALLRLWGPSAVGRLQLGGHARAGAVRLVQGGDPQRDLFHEHAHRFRIVVPAAWVADAAEERMLRRAIAAEKPAHVAYELQLVEERFRVGVQSTVGVDTILGDIPRARLSCQAEQERLAPSGGPRHRLGYDTVLSGRPSALPALPVRLDQARI